MTGNAAALPVAARAERLIGLFESQDSAMAYHGRVPAYRIRNELRALAAGDESGKVDEVVLGSLFNRIRGRDEWICFSTALMGTTRIKGKDVTDAYSRAAKAFEACSGDSEERRETLYSYLVGTREMLLHVLGGMGSQAADAAEFLVGELERCSGDPSSAREIRFVLGIIGHEPSRSFSETSMALQSGNNGLVSLVELMADLPLGSVVPDSYKGELASALTDLLVSEGTREWGGGVTTALALAHLGVADARTCETLRALMERIPPPVLPLSKSTGDTEYMRACEYVAYGYALACLEPARRGAEINRILRRASAYELGWYIPALLNELGSRAEPAIIDDVCNELASGNRLVMLPALAMLAGSPANVAPGTDAKILEIVSCSEDEDLRIVALAALDGVAKPSMAAVLLDLAKKEKSERLREAMEATAASLRLLE